MTDFPTLLDTSTSEIPTLSYTFHIYPSRAEPPRIGHYWEYSTGFSALSWVLYTKRAWKTLNKGTQQNSKQGGSKLRSQAIIFLK